MKQVLMLHGVNHNLFGQRDPRHYGSETLADIDARLATLAGELDVTVQSFQTNAEDAMVDRIHQALRDRVDAVLINAGANIMSLLAPDLSTPELLTAQLDAFFERITRR